MRASGTRISDFCKIMIRKGHLSIDLYANEMAGKLLMKYKSVMMPILFQAHFLKLDHTYETSKFMFENHCNPTQYFSLLLFYEPLYIVQF